jgi:esterase
MWMDAINALAFAIHYPEKLSHLVVIDAGPEVRHAGSSRIRDFVNGGTKPESLDASIERALAFNPRRDPRVLRRSLMHNLRQQSDGTWVWKYDRRRFQQMGEAHTAERRGLAERLAKVA